MKSHTRALIRAISTDQGTTGLANKVSEPEASRLQGRTENVY